MANGLTTRKVENEKPGPARKEISDGYMHGLYLIVQPSGQKSWAVRYRYGGRTRKYTIGSFPCVNLKSARDLAGKALRAVSEGRDPGQEKAQARSQKLDSVDSAIEQFIERHCRPNNRPRTLQSTERLLRSHVSPRWRGRPINGISRRDVLDVIDHVVDRGAPVSANRTLTAIKTFFTWAAGRDLIATSPAQGVKPPTVEHARDRVLTDNELRLLWQACEAIGWPFGPMVQMLLVTGQRRSEVAEMRWNEVDLKTKLWTLPGERVKNGEAHMVPLSPLAVSILTAMPKINGRFVFSTNGETASSGFSRAKQHLDARLPANMEAWCWHDLRRTFASGAAKLGVSLPVIEKVLNHTSGSFGGIVSVYQHHDFADEKRAALQLWAHHVSTVVADTTVVSLRKSR